MKRDFVIGDVLSGGKLRCDVATLLDTRLLIQSNSGGGKSQTLRYMLEQTHPYVPQIVIDYEGDFGTLREKFDYVLAAPKGGDVVAHPRTAALLAERLLELRVSAIVDIYELVPHERISFVRNFLTAIINARKELWHPWIIVLDEAHIFAPEQGRAESLDAVVSLASLGRKRGFCAWFATQRIAKFHKDAAAECNNTLIGRTRLDLDRKRAGEDLGFSKERTRELLTLPPGTFYASGPAFNVDEPTKVQIGDVQTTHPKAGSRLKVRVPPPSAKVKAKLAQLADLPAEAEERSRTVDELKAEVTRLKRELAKVPATPVPKVEKQVITVPLLRPADLKVLARIEAKLASVGTEHIAQVHAAIAAYKILTDDFQKLTTRIKEVANELTPATVATPRFEEPVGLERTSASREKVAGQAPTGSSSRRVAVQREGNGELNAGARRMLAALGQFHPKPLSRGQIGMLSQLSWDTGTFRNYLGDLKRVGYVVVNGDTIALTTEGCAAAEALGAVPQTPQELLRLWRTKFVGGARRMFELLMEAHPESMTREALGNAAGIAWDTGTFRNYLGDLKRAGVIQVNGQAVCASPDIFVGQS